MPATGSVIQPHVGHREKGSSVSLRSCGGGGGAVSVGYGEQRLRTRAQGAAAAVLAAR